MLDWLKGWLDNFAEWILELLQWIPKKIYSVVMEGIAAFFNAIPVPDFVSQAAGAFGGIPSTVMYFASMFELNFGLAVVLSALVARFILRRIPLIG
ncbi:hypothetical protein D9M70_396240 [compost metagenome]